MNKYMNMYYITLINRDRETLFTVAGNQDDAELLTDFIRDRVQIRSLNELFDNNVEIPEGLKWIVESDRKFQRMEMGCEI